jgi:hypothetical protein
MASDVFVSYAHRDNTAAEGEPFVARLLKYIGTECSKKYGRDIQVFDEGVLASGTQWEKAIYDELAACRIFLPIVSPSWVASNWAGDQWDAVSQRVKQDRELGRQTRIVPIAYLLKKGREELPEKVRSLELRYYFDEVMDTFSFRMKVDLLANEIADLLKLLDRNAPPLQVVATDAPGKKPPAPPVLVGAKVVASEALDRKLPDPPVLIDLKVAEERSPLGQSPIKSKVYLGFAFSTEARRSRDRIRSELADRGYGTRTLEEIDASWTAQQLISAIEKQVDDCAAAVHFLEGRAGPTLAGDDRPVAQIQCDLARQWEAKRSNLFWTGQVPDEKLKNYPEFIHHLKYNNDPIAAFVSSLLNSLREQEKRIDKSLRQEPPAQPIIWVICEKGDLDVAPDIVRFFADKGWVAFVPGFNFRETPYAKIFEKENYFLFYWGKGERDWCQINYEELVDARRVPGGFRPPRAALVYNGQVKLDYKEAFQWSFLKAPEYDHFNPRAPKVQEFVARVASTFNSSSYADSTA